MKPAVELPIIQRGSRFILQKTFEGKQRQIALGSNMKTAKSRALRFLATAEKSGFETAVEELKGKKVIKAGCNPTFDEMAALYRDYCQQTAKAPREQTIRKNLERLKFIMAKADWKTISQIEPKNLFTVWFPDGSPSESQRRTYASAISAASGVFKKFALDYYASRGIPLANPFKGLEVAKPKVSQFLPPSQCVIDQILQDCEELSAHDSMIVLMALGIGMRISEIEAALPSWFSVHDDKVLVHVRAETHFIPKNGESGIVPIHPDLYTRLIKLRGNSTASFFVPSPTDSDVRGRLKRRFAAVNAWLRSKGLQDRKPLHACRKTCGSIVAKRHGILEASKVLRNTPQVCAIHYAGIAELNTVDVGGTFAPQKDLVAQLAEEMGSTPEEIRAKLGIIVAK